MKNLNQKNLLWLVVVILGVLLVTCVAHIADKKNHGPRHDGVHPARKRSLISYSCEANQKIIAFYDNTYEDNRQAVITFNKQTVSMEATPAASGVRYSDGTYVWWTKGKNATLSEEKEEGKILVNHCVAEE